MTARAAATGPRLSRRETFRVDGPRWCTQSSHSAKTRMIPVCLIANSFRVCYNGVVSIVVAVTIRPTWGRWVIVMMPLIFFFVFILILFFGGVGLVSVLSGFV